jgi:hypothetical protein
VAAGNYTSYLLPGAEKQRLTGKGAARAQCVC